MNVIHLNLLSRKWAEKKKENFKKVLFSVAYIVEGNFASEQENE